MYRGALRSIISELLRQDRLIIVDKIAVDAPRTRELVEKLNALDAASVLIVSDQVDDNLRLAARNLPAVGVTDVSGIDPVRLVLHENVIMTTGAVKQLEERLG
jgi:large subunit ribosomal protein L4